MAPAGWAGPLSPHPVAGSRAPCTKAYESFVPAAAASIGFAASSVGAVDVGAALCACAPSTLGIGLHGKTTRRSSAAITVTCPLVSIPATCPATPSRQPTSSALFATVCSSHLSTL